MCNASVLRNFAKEILTIDRVKASSEKALKVDASKRELLFLSSHHSMDNMFGLE
jgi:hypothetical protein